MAKAFAQQGFQVLAVDSSAPQGVPALTLDLCKAHNQKVLLDLVQSSRVTAVHLAPPCSTSSAARQIDIGPGSPQPLRDFLHPDGLSDLPFHLRHRVSLANRLYSLTADVIRACAQAGTVWSLENPQSSLFWLTSPNQSLWRHLRGQIFFATFDACVYGGARKKATTFWSNSPTVQALQLRCTPALGHNHLPWGRLGTGWSTTGEAAKQPTPRHSVAIGPRCSIMPLRQTE